MSSLDLKQPHKYAGRDYRSMHFKFHFTAEEILWTLNFAATLVLLVVLLGRERIRRFPFFTANITLIGLTILAQRLLSHRLAQLVASSVFLVLADLAAVITLLLVIELSRRAFSGAKWPAWAAGSALLLCGAAAVAIFWGKWPPAKTVFDPSTIGHLRLMQLISVKGDLFNHVLAIELFALVVIAGRRFKAGWRSHTQQILVGLSASSATLLIEQAVWQKLIQGMPQTREGYNHMLDLQNHLLNADSMVTLAVIIWWIVCLWIDEPKPAQEAATAVGPPADSAEEIIERPPDADVPPAE